MGWNRSEGSIFKDLVEVPIERTLGICRYDQLAVFPLDFDQWRIGFNVPRKDKTKRLADLCIEQLW